MKKFVIGGNREQANHWIMEDLNRRQAAGETTLSLSEYVIVHGPDNVRGLRDPHGVFVGNWLNRTDILVIVEALLAASAHVNPALGKIYGDLKPKVRPTPKIVSGYQANIDEAGRLMAQAIDAEVLSNLAKKINGGIL